MIRMSKPKQRTHPPAVPHAVRQVALRQISLQARLRRMFALAFACLCCLAAVTMTAWFIKVFLVPFMAAGTFFVWTPVVYVAGAVLAGAAKWISDFFKGSGELFDFDKLRRRLRGIPDALAASRFARNASLTVLLLTGGAIALAPRPVDASWQRVSIAGATFLCQKDLFHIDLWDEVPVPKDRLILCAELVRLGNECEMTKTAFGTGHVGVRANAVLGPQIKKMTIWLETPDGVVSFGDLAYDRAFTKESEPDDGTNILHFNATDKDGARQAAVRFTLKSRTPKPSTVDVHVDINDAPMGPFSVAIPRCDVPR